MKRLILFLLLMFTVIAIWYFSIPVVISLYGEPEDVGASGDMFGAINSLFSGLALAGVIFAVWLQTLDVKTNREQLERTVESNKYSLEVMALSSLIQEAGNALERYERWEKSNHAGDYSAAKSAVRVKLKNHREQLESKLGEIKNT